MSDLDLDGLADAAIAKLREANRRLRAQNAVVEQRLMEVRDEIRALLDAPHDPDPETDYRRTHMFEWDPDERYCVCGLRQYDYLHDMKADR